MMLLFRLRQRARVIDLSAFAGRQMAIGIKVIASGGRFIPFDSVRKLSWWSGATELININDSDEIETSVNISFERFESNARRGRLFSCVMLGEDEAAETKAILALVRTRDRKISMIVSSALSFDVQGLVFESPRAAFSDDYESLRRYDVLASKTVERVLRQCVGRIRRSAS